MRMADDHAGPIDAPRDLAGRADQALGFVLGAKIRQIQAVGLIEHSFREPAAVAARRRDRTDEMKAAGFAVLREVDGMTGARDVRADDVGIGGGQVVERAEVEEMIDAPVHRAPLRL